eukprot:CAMPEP_0116926454 /NCGR_PEP_ID=MMETSP0467-20121206/24736_1 /TAXON_ID=283647 /ORGANISM="Mesodinium pulex, Strain SPMC105" /LENGTH=34 /DNA_ID= /DNA_START= /DNA_END= /DNA_ORIENTATION=
MDESPMGLSAYLVMSDFNYNNADTKTYLHSILVS